MHTKIEYKLLNIGTVREYFLLLTLSILRLYSVVCLYSHTQQAPEKSSIG